MLTLIKPVCPQGMQVFPGQACRGVARQSEDWSAREKILSACVSRLNKSHNAQ
jgi:hypothetical protein